MGLSAKEHEKRIERVFREKFNSSPKLFFSPGRINIIGEHVDYNNGFVLPAAIDKGIYFALAPNHSTRINVLAADLGQDLSFSPDNIQKSEGWKNYVLGVIHQLKAESHTVGGFDCAFGGDLPSGAGMSSSAALECGLATAVNDAFGLGIGRMNIAKICQRAEHNFPGVMCGIMDQFANMMGKRDHVMLLDCKSLEYRYLPMNLDDYSILMINSKVHHALASSEYNLRREQCGEGLHTIQRHLPNIHSLRDVKEKDLYDFLDLMPSEIFQKCLFVVQEISRTRQAAKLIEQGRINELGRLMFKAHEGLSQLYKVSCEELDFLVDTAEREPSVIGSRMMGGGFGGCTINIVKKESAGSFLDRVTNAYTLQFNIIPEAYEVTLGDGTHRLN